VKLFPSETTQGLVYKVYIPLLSENSDRHGFASFKLTAERAGAGTLTNDFISVQTQVTFSWVICCLFYLI
jgi:hypothetical protein